MARRKRFPMLVIVGLKSIPVLIAAVCLVFRQATGQNFTTIYSFNGDDGSAPQGSLIASGNTLYGTTLQGGGVGLFGGVVFALSTDGTGFTNLHLFFDGPNDGDLPLAGLILSGDTLYGTTGNGGSSDYGTVFSVNTDGSGYNVLYSFTNAGGAFPDSGLVLSGQTLYGTTENGGPLNRGTVFAINTNGKGFTSLHNFTGGTDEAFPSAGLLLSGDVLYGTTEGSEDFGGGSFGSGTVFSIKTDGSTLTALHVFTGNDGASPEGELVLSSNTLYGTAALGGTLGKGTVFAISTNGFGFTSLHNFTGTSDGAYPSGCLVLRGDTLYGTTQYGGSSSNGTVFAVNIDGTGFTNLYSFTALSTPCYPCGTNIDGANPAGGLALSGNALYGTAAYGGLGGNGTVFSISLPVLPTSPPSLTITASGQNVILSWPTNFTDFTLQSTTNLASPIWTTNPPAPVVVNGQYTVTNSVPGTQQFFRLSQ